MLDVSQFTPEEIAVTTTDRNIVIHGTVLLLARGLPELLNHFDLLQESMQNALTNTDSFHASGS